ncbi:branched-chain amino acid ABC transporter permease [Nonomuraea lactucae]|uniref:branched-chain amino acid ABC transporter permease n=1 Tax=Nonomuraea lactucae TaxID=2249762 RepID=UPI000DE22458|nr:branched-chain amino acid ABC transporter permease [Nonomuraea lactucae]
MQYLIDVLSQGSLYALCALGIALTFGVMRLINFAHGEFMMVGGYVLVVAGDIPVWAALLSSVIIVGFLAVATERIAFRPVRNADPETMLVTSFAVSFLLQSLAVLLFGSLGRSVRVFPPSITGVMHIGGLNIRWLDIITVAVTVTLLVSLMAFMKTRHGVELRAAAENFTVARLLGVKANQVIGTAFAISGVFAAATSIVLAAQRGLVEPTFGTTTMLFAFIAVIVGGMGSLPGAVLGAYALGLISVTSQALLPLGLRQFRDAFIFLVVVLILLLRPEGILRGHAARVRI